MRPKRMSRRQRGNSESAESDQKYHQILSNNLFLGAYEIMALVCFAVFKARLFVG